jgi:hypothetical protein
MWLALTVMKTYFKTTVTKNSVVVVHTSWQPNLTEGKGFGILKKWGK